MYGSLTAGDSALQGRVDQLPDAEPHVLLKGALEAEVDGGRHDGSGVLAPGEPARQLQAFELHLVDMLCAQATSQTARDVADKTWDLVHDRTDEDAVKRRVMECHEALARLSARGSGLDS